MDKRLTTWLNTFDGLAQGDPPDTFHHDGGRHATHIVVGSIVHGDEVGSLPAVVRLAQALREGRCSFGGRLSIFLGNRQAALKGQRFLEHDLNRVFMADAPDSHEGRRARQLMPLLDTADVFIDLHQTILPSAHRFWIAPFQVDGWHWARALQATPMWITRHPGTAFTTGACCADEYVRNRAKTGMTLELGERGFDQEAEDLAYRTLCRALAHADAVASGETTLEALAFLQPELTFLETCHRESFASDQLALRHGLMNFLRVEAGDALHASGHPPLVAPHSGWVLFPKYPSTDAHGVYKKPLPHEIYRIVTQLTSHPLQAYSLGPQGEG